ncbi:tail fiber domain-containing protein [Pseudomonas sp.]|uniref:tail fiber domain-containing protein n=1 Tax=Pseudomonas sp. TaxID=306 RepID=UPI00258B1D5F|nr:tail fiber domain-containing protein [Pseudomonas sp.]
MMFDDDFWTDASGAEYEVMPGRYASKARLNGVDRMIAVMEIGRNICFGGKGGGSAPTPDPLIGQAAMKNAELGEDWLRFAREQFNVGNIRQEELDALTESVIKQQMATQDETNAWAREDRTRTKEVFQPLQDEFIKAAREYDTPAKQAQAAAEARADVVKSMGLQSQANSRQMARMGINPNSGRFQEQNRLDNLNTALASAGAQNAARTQMRDKALALKGDAINIGSGLPSSAAAAYGLGMNAGNSATGNAVQANGNWRANVGIVGQGMQGAMQGYANQGNILNSLYGNQVNAWAAQQQANATSAAGLGQLVGTGIGAYAALSDARTKTIIKPAGELPNGIKLYLFEYKPEFREKWGDGQYIGVIAQEVEKVVPEAVTEGNDGYKVVDYRKVVDFENGVGA